MRKSCFFYQENDKNQSNNECNNINSCYDKMNNKKINSCCENKDNYKKNDCYDNKQKCFCYQYLLGATGPTGPSAGLSAYGGRFNNTAKLLL